MRAKPRCLLPSRDGRALGMTRGQGLGLSLAPALPPWASHLTSSIKGGDTCLLSCGYLGAANLMMIFNQKTRKRRSKPR